MITPREITLRRRQFAYGRVYLTPPGDLSRAATAGKYLDNNLKYKIDGRAHHTLQLGQFKQPNSLEEQGSTKNNDFISKAAITNTWALSRRLGAAYSVDTGNWSVTGAAFSRELTRGSAAGDGFGLRGTWAPIDAAGRIFHLGLSHMAYNAELPLPGGAGNTAAQRWRARPQADLARTRLVDTGTLSLADKVRTTGLEVLLVQGPVKLQGEFMRSTTTRDGGMPDFTGSGAYASALWNVTGESWGYKAGTATTPLADQPATGMLQLGLRYDTLDLNHGHPAPAGTSPAVTGVLGGKMDVWTVGANYYWHSHVKVALNYVKALSSKYSAATGTDLHDNPSIVEMRAQLHW